MCFTGYSYAQEELSQAAIEESAKLNTVQEKINYLISQASQFYGSEKFQQTVSIAQYILTYLDQDSQPAKDILEKAKQAIAQTVQTAVQGQINKVGFGQQ